MFNQFKYEKSKMADKIFSVRDEEDDDGGSSDTESWSGTPPDTPPPLIRRAPITTIPETPPENWCKVSNTHSERSQPCASNVPSFYGVHSSTINNSSSSARATAGMSASSSSRKPAPIRLAFKEKSSTASSENGTTDSKATARSGKSLDVMRLVEMFPETEPSHLQEVLDGCEGNVEAAVGKLLAEDGESPMPALVPCGKRRRLVSGDSDDGGDVVVASSAVTAAKRSRRISSADNGSMSLRISPRSTRSVSVDESPIGRKPRGRRAFLAASDDEDENGGGTGAGLIMVSEDDENTEEYYVDNWMHVRKDHVLHFLNTAKGQKMATVMKVSYVKQMRSRRPFASWEMFLEQLADAKIPEERIIPKVHVLVEDILVMRTLMEKCDRVSKRLKSLFDNSGRASHLLPQPKNLNTNMTLTTYQRIGLTWMVQLYKEEVNGILADEMGLGKTVQAIAYLAQLMCNKVAGPYLIAVPSSTIENWEREIALWCPDMNDKLLSYRGSQPERLGLQEELRANPGYYQVVLTSYTTCTGNYDRKFLRHCNFTVCVLDEGHMLKNMVSQRYAYMSRICPTRRLLLTGTPLQNNLTELLSLLHFTMPDIFSPTQECIRRLFSTASGKTAQDEGDGSVDSDDVDKIARTAHHIMQPFVLRRLKADVLDNLPAKEHKVVTCAMVERQRDMYTKKLQHIRSTSALSLSSLMELRKLANHPLLCRGIYTDAVLRTMADKIYRENTAHYNVNFVEEDMSVMSDFELHKLCLQHPSLRGHELSQDQLMDSGKFKQLDILLPTYKRDGDRVLLFSQFVIMLDIVEVYLKAKGYRFLRLDGSTAVSDRQSLIDDYSKDKGIFIFLLSTKAGGLGINLTAANVAILHDIDLNPHNDRQAEDRCHRVGQTKCVSVVRLLSQHTVDEVMMRVAERKLKLEKDVALSDESSENVDDAAKLLMEAFNA
eukprot:scpid31460/ scgid5564/ SWI/SNF-related matrix-associated actin-dependent regulator of chromatin subfamily A containing DEAD/H box 1